MRFLIFLGKIWFKVKFDVGTIDCRKAISRKTVIKEKNTKVDEKEK